MRRTFQNFLCKSDKFRMGSHLSLSCDNRGEASIPRSDLSRVSDTAGEAARSSTELQVDPMLPFLEGKIIALLLYCSLQTERWAHNL